MNVSLRTIGNFLSFYGNPRTYDSGLSRLGEMAATDFAIGVRRQYRAEAKKTRAKNLVLASYRLGKREGTYPARPPRTPGQSLMEISKQIEVHRGMGATWLAVAVSAAGIVSHATKRYTQGIPSRLMAHWFESGKTSTITETWRMLGYTATIGRGKPGYGSAPVPGSRAMPDGSPPNARKITIAPRKHRVFEQAFQSVMPKVKRKITIAVGKFFQLEPLKRAISGQIGFVPKRKQLGP